MSLLFWVVSNVFSWLFLKQLSSLRSGHRRLTGSPTSEDQLSSNQPSPSGAISHCLRSSFIDNKNDSTKKTNRVRQIWSPENELIESSSVQCHFFFFNAVCGLYMSTVSLWKAVLPLSLMCAERELILNYIWLDSTSFFKTVLLSESEIHKPGMWQVVMYR